MVLTDEEKKERNRQRVRAYRLGHKKEIKTRMSLYRENNKDKLKAQMANYRELNRGGIRQLDRQRYKQHKEDKSVRMKAYWEKSIETLSDTYIKKLLSSRSNLLSPKDIPQSLIQAKRAEIKLKRLIKE